MGKLVAHPHPHRGQHRALSFEESCQAIAVAGFNLSKPGIFPFKDGCGTAGFAGGFGGSAADRRSAAEETCEAISVPSGRTDPLRAGSVSAVCADAWEASPSTA
jgi:hypothetical protein